MAVSDDQNDDSPEKQTWGTFEELLLACAVHRYGTDNWDSVAAEVRKRSSVLRLLTPLSCRQKYLDLRRRFSEKDAVSKNEDEGSKTKSEIGSVPWLDELRKLRVAELRREVQRYDLSILSLQLKLKKLEEEREQSVRKHERDAEKSDLDKIAEEDKKESHGEEEDNANGESVQREWSERPNSSVNGSNSTDPAGESAGTGPDHAKKETDPVEPDRVSEDAKPVGEDSCGGSSNSVAKESAANSVRGEPEREASDSPELAESKGGGEEEEEAKESSDVQSSARLERRGNEPENDVVHFPAVKRVPDESQPLADFLDILQAHKIGSLFSRRLDSQEASGYEKLIRQHTDVKTIQTRLEDGCYVGYNAKFFRDLLLLLSNATVFYGKGSSEFLSAAEIRQLVAEEMAIKLPKQSVSQKEEQNSEAPQPENSKPDPKPSQPLILKARMSVPLNACRKRSSLSTRASGSNKKMPQKTPAISEKPLQDVTEREDDEPDEPRVRRKRTRDVTSAANKGNKSGKNGGGNTSVAVSKGVASSNDGSETKKTDKDKKSNTTTNAKKQSVVSFLKRMTRGTASEDGSSMLEKQKHPVDSDVGKGEKGKQKRNNSSNDISDSRKGQTTQKKSIVKKPATKKGSATKSAVQTSKRPAVPISPLPAKRGREGGVKESGSSGHAKKRTRR